jgi:hypothetical protein
MIFAGKFHTLNKKEIKMKTKVSFKLKSGKYVISDLCYLIKDDDWSDLCNYCEENQFFTKGFDKPISFKEMFFWMGSTKWGDGCYSLNNKETNESYDVPVDSGSIGIIRLDESKDNLQSIDKELSNVFEFGEDFLVTYDGENFSFGPYEVSTDFDSEEDYFEKE